jgi:transcriptional regulator with XRE-family HTH domain
MSDIFRDYSFGGWVHQLRIEQGYTLREFAKKLNMDAGNLSKLERSELKPPRKAEKIKEICVALDNLEAYELLKSIAFQHHLSELMQEFE